MAADTLNQTPEQRARDLIDQMLAEAGWIVQEVKTANLGAGPGVAIRHYLTQENKELDYALFVDRQPVGVIEAKREEEGVRLTMVEEQSAEYASSKLRYLDNDQLPFVYESTGELTRFTDMRDPRPRSRPVFSFHRPETFSAWLKNEHSLRERLLDIPGLPEAGLRACQINAINNLERSFKDNRPRALIQMATGSGKTFTAITSVYRLLKHAGAKRILFLVDTKNLGEQAEQEFMKFTPQDDNRQFTELYNVQRLNSRFVPTDTHVCISTIQRMYSILQGKDMDDEMEQHHPEDDGFKPKEPVPVAYNPKLPIEFFDFIIIDECHRSIYNLWRQVLDYFDSFLIGLTATPDKRTFGFFNENIVSHYTHDDAVADGVNVPHDVFLIETKIGKEGALIPAHEQVDFRHKLTRKRRWKTLDDEVHYQGGQLDRDIVNPSQIRNVIKAYRDNLPKIFPGRNEVPKTLIFAKTDSHADDIIQMVREEFGEGNAFCKKVTYRSEEDPKSVLQQFRNEYNPRIAVTVDMIATGTDVKPLECLIFMRLVKSRNYFEQMKGRGTRTLGADDLKKVSPSAHDAKTHFVIVDAIGVTKTVMTDSRPLERKPSTSMKDLLGAVTFGTKDEDVYSSLAGRLARLQRQMDDEEQQGIREKSGQSLSTIIHKLMDVSDPDAVEQRALQQNKLEPDNSHQLTEEQLTQAQQELMTEASSLFSGQLNQYILDVKRSHEQLIDTLNPDEVLLAEWSEQANADALGLINDFRAYIEEHKDDILALQILYSQPYHRRELSYSMIKELLDKLKRDKPTLLPGRLWQAYSQAEEVKSKQPDKELSTLLALLRRVIGIDSSLTPYSQTVDKNFQNWVFEKQAGAAPKFNEEQMNWLRMIKDHIAQSFHIERDDLELAPFDAAGGMGRMYQLFGDQMDNLLTELNEHLAA